MDQEERMAYREFQAERELKELMVYLEIQESQVHREKREMEVILAHLEDVDHL